MTGHGQVRSIIIIDNDSLSHVNLDTWHVTNLKVDRTIREGEGTKPRFRAIDPFKPEYMSNITVN